MPSQTLREKRALRTIVALDQRARRAEGQSTCECHGTPIDRCPTLLSERQRSADRIKIALVCTVVSLAIVAVMP